MHLALAFHFVLPFRLRASCPSILLVSPHFQLGCSLAPQAVGRMPQPCNPSSKQEGHVERMSEQDVGMRKGDEGR